MKLLHRLRRYRDLLWLVPMISGHVSAASADPLILNTQQWSPFEWEREGVQGGIAIDVVKCVVETLGQEVEIRFLPWKRAQVMVQNGAADGFFPASLSPERDAFAVRSDPVISVDWVWFTMKDSDWDIHSEKFKTEAVVAAERGSYYGSWLETSGYTVRFHPDNHLRMALMLKRNRVDAFLANDLVLAEELKGSGIGLDEFDRVTIKSDPLGVYFSSSYLQDKPDFMDKFNAAIPGCRKAQRLYD